ncbi:MAG: trypsin-like peptidase domain-containing protein [Blastocatellia bacterium]
MEKKFNDSTKRAKCARRLTSTLALSLGLGLYGSNNALVFGQQAPQTQMATGARTVPSETVASPAELSRAFVNVAKRVKPAVVHINILQNASPSARGANPRGFPQVPGVPPQGGQPRARRGTGSGVIVSPSGYILTNNHVAGGAYEIKVRLSDGRELTARRIGVDPETDLALIKVEAQNLPFAVLGDSSKLEQGEWVIALGSPFGLEQTMTAGIVSATGREFGGAYDNYIQTDASINPGNSGGPLVNMNGEVVGINTMIYSRSGGSEGIGFSVPSNLAKKVQEQLLRNGRMLRGYLGVGLQTVSPATAKSLGYEGGAMVGEMSENSPAARAGLRGGDVIVEIDGKPVKSPKHLTEIVGDSQASKTVQLKFIRDGRLQTTSITLGERPGRSVAQNRDPRAGIGGRLGLSYSTVTSEMANAMKLRINSGVVIDHAQPGSPAANAGLRRGDVIHSVNRAAVTRAQDLTAALQSLNNVREVVFQIERGGQLTSITVTLS